MAGCLALLPANATAQSIEDANTAYADGRFVEAADIGEALGTSDGYTLAAKSLAVHAHYEASDEEFQEVIDRAMRMGEAAIAADPNNPDAHYQSAHAVGRYAQRVGAFTALREGLASKIRDLLEATLAIDPDYVDAMLGLGGWHADLDAEGFLARRMYGGSKDEAITLFERALEMAPDSKVVLHAYAIRVPHLYGDDSIDRARAMLERALDLPVRDAYEEYVHFDVLDALDDLAGR
jgi:tetratricopeptide (TPR) repeat protein